MSEIKGTIKQQDGTVLLPHTDADIVKFTPQGSGSSATTVAAALQTLLNSQISITEHNTYIELAINGTTYYLLKYLPSEHNTYIS